MDADDWLRERALVLDTLQQLRDQQSAETAARVAAVEKLDAKITDLRLQDASTTSRSNTVFLIVGAIGVSLLGAVIGYFFDKL